MDYIWKPQTFIFNAASDGFLPNSKDLIYVQIKYDGTVSIMSPALSLQTRCILKFQNYPFDNQICNFTMLSWPVEPHSPSIIYIADMQSNNQSNANHSVWNIGLISITPSYLIGYNSIPQTTSVIYIVFPLVRKGLYYIINTILPCEILNIIIMFAFFIPFANQMALSKFL